MTVMSGHIRGAQIESSKSDYTNIERMRTTEETGIGLKWPHISGTKRTGGLEVKYSTVKKCHQYTAGGDKCDVCLSEKLAIMKDKGSRSINTRTELMNTCRHKWRQKLAGNKKL